MCQLSIATFNNSNNLPDRDYFQESRFPIAINILEETTQQLLYFETQAKKLSEINFINPKNQYIHSA